MSFLSRQSATAAQSSSLGDLSKDIAVSAPPDDSISDIKWSSVSDHLAVASWDNKVRIYEINGSGSSEGKAIFEGDGPMLSCDWSKDGQKVVGAGTDKTARILDLGANGAPAQQVAVHDAPIKAVRFFEAPNTNAPMIATGSWDKTVKYWDLRQSTPVGSLACQDRVYSMDAKDKLLIIGTANRQINIVNLNNPNSFFKTMESPLKCQTRVVSCFNDATGFAVGSIEGRCAFQWMDPKKTSSNFSFKCHRDPPQNNTTNVWAVNAISFHPIHGTFSTAGADGTFHFWDKEAKHRLKGYPSVGGSISATDFNNDGSIFAYAISYDWHKGYSTNNTQYPIRVMLHPVTGDECKPRATINKR